MGNTVAGARVHYACSCKQLHASKMEEEEYDRIVSFLKTRVLPTDFTKNRKDSFRRKCKQFVAKDDTLYYRDHKKNIDLQVIVPFKRQVCAIWTLSLLLLLAAFSPELEIVLQPYRVPATLCDKLPLKFY